ncbi:MAG: hypothetical protein JWQ30_2395, partial [Sediminibacterium sp.]|nr:hypothetical protein [Sediminibacterium sp.]
MARMKIMLSAEKQVSAELELDDIIHHVNELQFKDRIPIIIKMLEGITESDIRFLPYSVGLTIGQLLEQKA